MRKEWKPRASTRNAFDFIELTALRIGARMPSTIHTNMDAFSFVKFSTRNESGMAKAGPQANDSHLFIANHNCSTNSSPVAAATRYCRSADRKKEIPTLHTRAKHILI